MAITTMSSRDFARGLAAAKKAAECGPVIVTELGRPSHVLLAISDYDRLAQGKARSLLDLMDAIPGGAFDFAPPRIG